MWDLFNYGGKTKPKSKSKTVHYYKPTHNKSTHNKSTHNNDKIVIGKIYANWCKHCINLNGEWEIMKQNIQNNYPDKYIFSEIEQANQNTEIAEINKKFVYTKNKVNIQGGYPTIFKIQNGKVEYYNGAHLADNMESWFIIDNKPNTKKNINGGTRRKRKKL